jgi:hypothetical protein
VIYLGYFGIKHSLLELTGIEGFATAPISAGSTMRPSKFIEANI